MLCKAEIDEMGMTNIKNQAFLFLKTSFQAARLLLTDITPTQLMTEEATNDDPWGPHSQTMSRICEAAFEPDEYWRILQVIQIRLSNLDERHRRSVSKTLEVTEYLLTHGPFRFSEDIKTEMQDVFAHLLQLQHTDNNGTNLYHNLQAKAARILELIDDKELLCTERSRRRSLSREIRRGSLSSSSSSEECPGGMEFMNSNPNSCSDSERNRSGGASEEEQSEDWEESEVDSVSSDSFSDKFLYRSLHSESNDFQNGRDGREEFACGFALPTLRRRKGICGSSG